MFRILWKWFFGAKSGPDEKSGWFWESTWFGPEFRAKVVMVCLG